MKKKHRKKSRRKRRRKRKRKKEEKKEKNEKRKEEKGEKEGEKEEEKEEEKEGGERVGIWICRSEIKKPNNHQKSSNLYRNVRGGFSRVSFLRIRSIALYEKIFSKKTLSQQNVICNIF
jgi:hypothetical protein